MQMLKAACLLAVAAARQLNSPWVYAEKVALANGVAPGMKHVSYAYDWDEAFFPNFVDQVR